MLASNAFWYQLLIATGAAVGFLVMVFVMLGAAHVMYWVWLQSQIDFTSAECQHTYKRANLLIAQRQNLEQQQGPDESLSN